MSKNLKVIQTIFTVAKIVCQVLMVLCIVASAICVIAMICFGAGVDNTINWGNVTIHGLINSELKLSDGQIYMALTDGIIMGAASAVVFGFVTNYCKKEIAAGTPFTQEGSRQMLSLGIITLAVMIGAKIISSIACGIISAAMNCKFDYITGSDVSLSAGLLFILLSFVFAYGAEIASGNANGNISGGAAPANGNTDVFEAPADNQQTGATEE